MRVCQPYPSTAIDKLPPWPFTIGGALLWARVIVERAIPADLSKRLRRMLERSRDLAPDNRLVGYARVSTSEQSLDMQLEALRRAGVMDVNLHAEKTSGTSRKRPALELALKDARAGDVFVVWKLDRLGRSLRDLLNRIDELEKRGVGFRSLTEGIDTTTPAGRLIMHVMGALAQFERDLIAERTRAGVRAHMARGGTIGRKQVLGPKQKAQGLAWRKKGMSVIEIAKRLKVTPQTIYVRVLGRQPKPPKSKR